MNVEASEPSPIRGPIVVECTELTSQKDARKVYAVIVKVCF